jgi:hypothetical protein
MTLSCFRSVQDCDRGVVLFHQYLANSIPDRTNALGADVYKSGFIELLGDVNFNLPSKSVL